MHADFHTHTHTHTHTQTHTCRVCLRPLALCAQCKLPDESLGGERHSSVAHCFVSTKDGTNFSPLLSSFLLLSSLSSCPRTPPPPHPFQPRQSWCWSWHELYTLDHNSQRHPLPQSWPSGCPCQRDALLVPSAPRWHVVALMFTKCQRFFNQLQQPFFSPLSPLSPLSVAHTQAHRMNILIRVVCFPVAHIQAHGMNILVRVVCFPKMCFIFEKSQKKGLRCQLLSHLWSGKKRSYNAHYNKSKIPPLLSEHPLISEGKVNYIYLLYIYIYIYI